MTDVPQELNWVEKRAACNAAQLFNERRLRIERDVEDANKAQDSVGPFQVTQANRGRVLVVSQKHEVGPRVVFFFENNQIRVKDEARGRHIKASLTLNQTGRCVLKVNGEEMELWQFRLLALEEFFFGSTLSDSQTLEDQQ